MTVPKEVREAMARAARAHLKTLVGLGIPDVTPKDAEIGQAIDAALSALKEIGWQLAKIEPTQVMVLAGRATQYDDKSYSVLRVWDAMLAASLEGTG